MVLTSRIKGARSKTDTGDDGVDSGVLYIKEPWYKLLIIAISGD